MKRKGFTLIELIIVIAIMGVLAAISTPSLVNYYKSGKQTNRMNIARTIYLAAQNQLTELRVTRTLKSFTRDIEAGTGTMVSTQIGITFLSVDPADPNPITDHIYYIKKSKGAPAPNDPVAKLLEPVLTDKTVLNDAIVIEFNIKTGVVMSVFYSDVLDSDGFKYREDPEDDSPENIAGDRPYSIDTAYVRTQGYYGVDAGETDKEMRPDIDREQPVIEVYDSFVRGLPGNEDYDNVLYAEIIIPEEEINNGTYSLTIQSGSNMLVPVPSVNFKNYSDSASGFSSAVMSASPAIYRYDGSGTPDYVGTGYARFIWVLDYVGGNMAGSDAEFGIAAKYPSMTFDPNSNIQVGIQGNVSAESTNGAHPFMHPSQSGKSSYNNLYLVGSARHLYNMRYLLGGSFTQIASIDLSDSVNGISVFPPIGQGAAFTGSFDGRGCYIAKLNVVSALPNTAAGLFGVIDRNGGIGVSVLGLTLENPSVSGIGNVGAVCGTLNANSMITGVYVRYTEESKLAGTGCTGGIAGENKGVITDVTFVSPTTICHIESDDKEKAGGIAGISSGASIKRALFLSLAPEKTDGKLCPIAGGDGNIMNSNTSELYYLSGAAVHPGPKTGYETFTEYNVGSTNDAGVGMGTAELYETVISGNWGVESFVGKKPSEQDEQESIDNEIYPYPFSAYSTGQTTGHPNWPIAGDAGSVEAGVTYYEVTDDNNMGFSASLEKDARTLVSKGSDLLVINDGYAVEFSYHSSGYTLELNDVEYDVTVEGTEYTADWTVAEALEEEGTKLRWPVSQPFPSADGEYETMFRLYLPNEVLEESAADSGSNTIRLTLSKKSGDASSVVEETFNPFFAPSSVGLIRSPRHIRNITTALEDEYEQQLNVDFSLYCMELDENCVADNSTVFLLEEAAVLGEFTGIYFGNSRYIDNVTIDSDVNCVGLFEQNSGKVENVTLRNAVIKGDNTVGAIAGRNEKNGIVTRCVLKINEIIAVGDNAGGVVGINVGTINGCDLTNIRVNGKGTVGGVAGDNSGNIGEEKKTAVTRVSYTVVTPGSANVNLDNVIVAGVDYVGGITGKNIKGVISDCALYALEVSGSATANTFVGGVAGLNTGKITRSFVGQNIGGVSRENKVSGAWYVGGIAGFVGGIDASGGIDTAGGLGLIEICYVDYTSVGSTTSAKYVGGIAGYLNVQNNSDSTFTNGIRNVFYNYGNASPQIGGWKTAITGDSSATGGLVGYLNRGALQNAYNDANHGSNNNFLIGGINTVNITGTLSNSLLYLGLANYNNAETTGGGTKRSVLELSSNVITDTSMETMYLLNGSATSVGSVWQLGSSAGNGTETYPSTYTYPRLKDLSEPVKWPFLFTTGEISRIAYYEIYENANPKIGTKASDNYGLWFTNDDKLDYTQKVLEDGYLIMIESGSTLAKGNNSFTYQTIDGKVTTTFRQKAGNAVTVGGYLCIVLNLEEIENFAKNNGEDDAICPIRVGASQSGSGFSYLDVYVNPLFAKSIFTRSEIDRLCTASGYGTTNTDIQNFFRKEYQYLVRTPRHLNNLGFDKSTLKGIYAQEIDIDFAGLNSTSGYYYNTTVRNTENGNSENININININKSVVSNTTVGPRNGTGGTTNSLVFTGRYTGKSPSHEFEDDDKIRTIKNIRLPNNPPNATAQHGNIGIFPAIGEDGVVENLILENNVISGATGSVGGLSGINDGTIRNISSINCTVSVTDGKVGGIVGVNTGAIENVSFVSNSKMVPINAPVDKAGGIASENSGRGTITNVLYLAHAPDKNPITANTIVGEDGDINDIIRYAYYLSGTVSINDRSTTNAANITGIKYNDFIAKTGGQPRTSQELNQLTSQESKQLSASGWSSVRVASNVLTSTSYPYPYLFRKPPESWPIATVPADNVAYYEKYQESDGTFSYGLSTTAPSSEEEESAALLDLTVLHALDADKPIIETGYCVIMPDNFLSGRRYKINTDSNLRVFERIDEADINMARITSVTSNGTTLNRITVNDITSKYINTLFAKCVYDDAEPTPSDFSIRTPVQMQNISRISNSSGLFFKQERDLEFNGLTNSVVTSIFRGQYDGAGRLIANLSIDASVNNVGLFSQNSGTIRNLMIDFGNSGGVKGNSNVGSVAGINNKDGVISDITVVSTSASSPVSGKIIDGVVGGVVGKNDGGIISRILYLAVAPSGTDGIYPIAGENIGQLGNENSESRSVSNAYYLSGTIAATIPGETTEAKSYNTSPAALGLARTTEDLISNLITSEWIGWKAGSGTNGEMQSESYPYPYINTKPKAWPVTAIKSDAVVAYYERYSDDTYGYYTATSSMLPRLNDADERFIESAGYCVIMSDSYTEEESYFINKTLAGITDHAETKVIEIPFSSKDGNLTGISINGKLTGIYINTLFAKAVYPSATAPMQFYIRTPEQMRNIGLVNTEGIAFTQEHDLDFKDEIALDTDGAVVKGIFEGAYNGAGKVISGAAIKRGFVPESNEGTDNVGLFSQNNGLIENVILRGDKDYPITMIGTKNVGGIVGHNLQDGVIRKCVVEGTEYTDPDAVGADSNPIVTYKGVIIEATGEVLDGEKNDGINAGGIAGMNDGEIVDCAISNIMKTIKGDDYVGGIAGHNGAEGVISGATVSNVFLEEAEGKHIGKLVGWNDNEEENAVKGEADGIPLVLPEAMLLVGLPICVFGKKRRDRR